MIKQGGMDMSLAVSRYVKQFYRGNIFAATENGRNGRDVHNLISADIKAVRRAVQGLGDYDYDEGEGGELMNKVQAFVNTYNNYIGSAKEMDDSNVTRYASQLKKLTKENAEELEDIGITVLSSGKLKVDKEVLQDATRYEVSKVFSADAEYSTEVEKRMKKTDRMIIRNNLNIPKPAVQKKTESNNNSATGISMQASDENAQLVQQLTEVLSGSQIDFTV